jgi:iron complex transport system substrate-binding protein
MRWASVRAVQDKRIYLAPNLPYGWFDAPPGVNRLMGVRWLTSVLYPKQFSDPGDDHGSSTSSSTRLIWLTSR